MAELNLIGLKAERYINYKQSPLRRARLERLVL
jgi:hypothetical protein